MYAAQDNEESLARLCNRQSSKIKELADDRSGMLAALRDAEAMLSKYLPQCADLVEQRRFYSIVDVISKAEGR